MNMTEQNSHCWRIFVIIFALIAIGLGCERKQVNPVSRKNHLEKPSPKLSKGPLDLRKHLASGQNDLKRRGQIEDFRQKFAKGFKQEFPNVTSPHFVDADAVLLPDTADVLGISTNGVSRAYLVVGMWEMRHHVLHDSIAGQPITITYCDINDCAHAYQSQGILPMDFKVGGWDGRNLLLLIQGKYYAHQKAPLPTYPIKRTTWGKWKTQHPNTKIYLGFFSEEIKK